MADINCVGVTGGLGFIGSNLIPELRKRYDCQIRVLDNFTNISTDLVIDDHIKVSVGDIRNIACVNEFVDGCDVIIHLAAHTRVIESIEDPETNIDINIHGSFNIINACRKYGVSQFVNASTGGAILGEVSPPIHEELAGKPSSPYGASKAAVEALCWAYAQSYGMNAVSLRFANVYGPNSRNKESVVAKFFKDILNNEEIVVYGDGEQTRDFFCVTDLVAGIVSAIDLNKTGVYQLASGKPLSINELISYMREIVEKDFKVTYLPARAGEILHTYCDITKSNNELNWYPSTDISDGLISTYNYVKSTYR